MRVGELAARAVALEEGPEVTRGDGARAGDGDRLEELAKAQKVHALAVVLVALREVEARRALGEVRRLRHVEDVAAQRAQARQGERGLAAAGAAHEDEGERQRSELGLSVVERDRLVEILEARPRRAEVVDRQRSSIERGGSELLGSEGARLVDARAAQEP